MILRGMVLPIVSNAPSNISKLPSCDFKPDEQREKLGKDRAGLLCCLLVSHILIREDEAVGTNIEGLALRSSREDHDNLQESKTGHLNPTYLGGN